MQKIDENNSCKVCSDFKSWIRLQREQNKNSKYNYIEYGEKIKNSCSSNSNELKKENATEAIDKLEQNKVTNLRSEPPPSKNRLHQLLSTSNLSGSVFDLQCPVDSEELGRSGWTLLHTMAAYFPEKPNENMQKDMSNFMTLLSRLYPCTRCAKGLRKDLKNEPPDVSSRSAFSQWMCRLHNKVNEKLGKPAFDCKFVDERWRDGWKDGRCD